MEYKLSEILLDKLENKVLTSNRASDIAKFFVEGIKSGGTDEELSIFIDNVINEKNIELDKKSSLQDKIDVILNYLKGSL